MFLAFFTKDQSAITRTLHTRPGRRIGVRFPSPAPVLGAVLAASSWPATAAEFSGYLSFKTDYVWRGVTQSDGHPAAQVGGDLSFDSGFYAGLWGSTVDIDNGPARQRDKELTAYLGYGYELDDRWILSATLVSYNYPGQTGSVDYDYEEIQLNVNHDDRIWFQYAYSPDLYDSGYDSHNAEVYAEWQLGGAMTLGAGVGYYDVAALTGSDYGYWEFGLTRPFGPFDVDLRYHDTNRWVPIVSSADRAGSRVALSVLYSF